MADERAEQYLSRFGLEGRVRDFDVPTATVEEAARALGCEPRLIAKTLAFQVGDEVVLVVAAGDARVDNKKFRAAFGGKGRMVRPEDAKQLTGYAPGGVCPFGVPEDVLIGLDESLRRFPTVYPACGTASSAVRLSPAELAQCLPKAVWVDVCTVPGPELDR